MNILDRDEQMNAEIEKLNKSPLVALARKEQRIKYRKRQYLYSLRNLEKRGKQLQSEGVTMESLEAYLEDLEREEDGE